MRITPGQPCPLAHGDVVRIGDPHGNSISLTYQERGGGAPKRSTVLLDTGQLAAGRLLTVGRDPQCDIALPSPLVSRRHAQIERTSQGDVLTDLGSMNGTFVNGQRITRHILRQGDVVQIGPFRLPYTAAGLAPSANIGNVRLDGLHLKRKVKDHKTRAYKLILDDVTLSIQPGEFVAVVGGSGAGKTTLMKALNGQTRADEGQVLLNGDDLYAHFDQYRMMMGYVPQDDMVHRDLTVESALRYAARLRLPPDTQEIEVQRRIDDALARLDMPDKKKDVISTLSGGQRKRVNIAVEMLADPDLFFLDEPGSGLDPGLEKKLMYDMQRVADSSKTVILITHATDNVGLCDHVVFMGNGGRLVFFGPPNEALTFFQAQSFADIYLKLGQPQDAQAWRQRFEGSPYYQQYVQNRVASAPPPAPARGARPRTARLGFHDNVRQFLILSQRYLELILRNRFSLFVLLAVMPIISLLLLLISEPFWLTGKYDPACEKAGIVDIADWDKDPRAVERCVEFHLQDEIKQGKTSATYVVANRAQTLLFMLTLAASLLGVFGAAFEVVKEKTIYERERMINLGLAPYLLSKFVVLAVFGILQGLLLLLVISLKVRLPAHMLLLSAPIEMYVTLVLTIAASIGLGLWISTLVPDSNSVVYFILLVLFAQIIFASVFFDLPSAVKPVSYVTITRWSLDGLGISARLNDLNQLSKSRVAPAGRGLPGPVDSPVAYKFQLSYECTTLAKAGPAQVDAECSRLRLVERWLILVGFAMAFMGLAAVTLKLKERI
jgi:ABC-type multidrug transport system ATPase subunit